MWYNLRRGGGTDMKRIDATVYFKDFRLGNTFVLVEDDVHVTDAEIKNAIVDGMTINTTSFANCRDIDFEIVLH